MFDSVVHSVTSLGAPNGLFVSSVHDPQKCISKGACMCVHKCVCVCVCVLAFVCVCEIPQLIGNINFMMLPFFMTLGGEGVGLQTFISVWCAE